MQKKIIIWYLIAALGVLTLYSIVQGTQKNSDENVDLKELSLTPAAEPVPALSYRLLPRYLGQKVGNAALIYYSAADLCPDGDTEEILKWRDMPVDQLDRKEVEEVLSSFSSCFHQIKLATQRNYCQWEMPLEEGYAMQLPHIATFRRIVMAMQLQARLYIADGKIEQAMEMLQEISYMGRNIAEGQTIIQDLVGIAIEALMLTEIENLIQTPNSPNLYWALTSLPDPLIDLHSSIQFEREVFFIEFPRLLDLENQVLTPAQALEIISDFINKIQSLDSSMNDFPFMDFLPTGWVMIHYSDAKKYLEDKGYSKEFIEAIPAAQAVLIYQKQQYQEIADNIYKWFELPYSQSQSHFIEDEHQFEEEFENQGIKSNLFLMLMPAVSRIAFLQARLERDIAMLRTIEAIRMYAAENSEQLPETLDEITSVPIPEDPVTGKNLIYHRINSQKAQLEAPNSNYDRDERPVYELTIKK